MFTYKYDGPVMEFQRVLCYRWKGETTANTEEKAISNLKYQFKREHKKLVSSQISFPKKITKEGNESNGSV